MKKTKLFTAIMSAGLLTGSIGFTSCEDEEGNSLLSNIVSVLFGGNEYAQNSGDNYFGWFANDEDTEHQAQDILLSTTKTPERLSSQNLPSKVDLTDNLPPIGNQGQYGTCVAWAVAYNCRTFLYSKQKGLSKSALQQYENNEFKDISHYAIIKLAKYYGVTTDYLLGLSETKKHSTDDINSLKLSDELIDILQQGKINI